ncbi:MAG: RHS repeat domain-containing protein, partial [Terriglobia bacterium]
GFAGYVTYVWSQGKCWKNYHWNYYSIYSDWAYFDPSGTRHSYTMQVSNAEPTCSGPAYQETATAADGSGYTMTVTPDSAVVYSPSGLKINPPVESLSGSATVTDSNGNYVSAATASGTTTFKDTLGATALTISGSGTPSSPVTYAYTDFSGTARQVVVNYNAFTVRTNFGCSSVLEYGPLTDNLVTSIDLPDGTSYQITYEGTPGFSGDVTGRIASVKLPSGGTITYAYSGANNGIICADGSAATLTRTTPDGTWTYAHSESGTAWTTTVTDPQGNQTVVDSQGTYETERDVYQGSTGGTLLEQVFTCYNNATEPCNSTAVAPPITQRDVTTTLGGVTSRTITNYNSVGLPTFIGDYAYGSGGAPGALMRQTNFTYTSLTGWTTFYRPQYVLIYDGSHNLLKQATYSYDQTGVTATSGTPQHVAVSGSRGNPTTVSVTGQSMGTLTRAFSYYDTGNVENAADYDAHLTSFSYSGTGNCGNSFPTTITQPLSLSSSMAWNCNAGVVASVTDPNTRTTNFNFDEFSRPLSASAPDGGLTSWTYNDAPPASEVRTLKLSGSANRIDTALLDGLGRVTQTQLNSDPAGADLVDTAYDSLGRVHSVSNPYRSGSTGSETYAYDALGRVTSLTYADGNQVLTYYGAAVAGMGGNSSRLCSASTYGLGYPVLTRNEVYWIRQVWYDALGRLIEVDETDPTNGGKADQPTCYSYDSLDNLTQIVQGSQTRSYGYDGLSRLIWASTPESGTTYYYHTTSGGGLCSGDASEVCRRTDARSITTTYTYDALNRLTEKSYSDTTPAAYYSYDQSSVSIGSWSSGTLTNTKGRMTEAVTGSPAQTGVAYSYDPMGRVAGFWQCTPYNCGSSAWAMTYNYDLAGDVTSWTHPAGYTITNSVNGAQEIYQIQSSLADATHPQYLAKNITYTPWGAENTLENGCTSSSGQEQGCTDMLETYTYNQRLQPLTIGLGTSSNPFADYCLVYNWYANSYYPNSCTPTPQAWGGDNGSLWNSYYGDNVNPSLSHTELFYYDGDNRLITAKATGNSTYNLAFSYDRYGNMTCTINGSTQGPCPQYTFNQSTNRISTAGFTYDAAGDMTSDGTNTYQYDAEGRQSSANGNFQTYNALGQFVSNPVPWTVFYFMYDPWGNRVGDSESNGEIWAQMVPIIGESWSVYSVDNGQMYFPHPNFLGSTAGDTDETGKAVGDVLYYPWGTTWTYAGNIWGSHFSAFDSNGFTARLYDTTPGRWYNPDLLGGDIMNPQSLNRYAYALNNPTTDIDPSGLCSDFDPVCNLEIDSEANGCDGFSVGLSGPSVVINWPAAARNDWRALPRRLPSHGFSPWLSFGGNNGFNEVSRCFS